MIRAIVLAILVAAAPAVAQRKIELDRAEMARAGVRVAPVEDRTFGDRVRVVGQVVRQPGSTITLKAIIPGRVEEILAAPGERVQAGELVVELHSHELLAMQSELLTSREATKLAETRVEAGRELYAIDGISRIELERREQEALAARLRSEATFRELVDHGLTPESVKNVLATGEPDPHLPVRSPVDGVVLELSVQQYEWVREYEPLVVVGDPARIEIVLQLPPDEAMVVRADDEVEFTPVGQLHGGGRARVITRVPEVDPVSRTVRVRARVEEGGQGLYPGVFVEGTIRHGAARTAPSVPESAVIRLGSDDVVFVRLGEGLFEARPVELGRFVRGAYEVRQGIAVGDEVAVEGVFLLKSALQGAEG